MHRDTYGLIVEVSCPNHVQEATLDRLQASLDCRMDRVAGRLLLTCYIQAPTALDAAEQLLDLLSQHAPDVVPLSLDDDLVAVSDIATRIGLTRQAVQLFARPTDNFPLPRATVASTRVWRWAEVNEWLRTARPERADAERWPSQDEATDINAALLAYRRQGARSVRRETLLLDPSVVAGFLERLLRHGSHRAATESEAPLH